MRNNVIILFVLLLTSCNTTNHSKNQIEIYYHSKDTLTIIPRNKIHVIEEGNYFSEKKLPDDYAIFFEKLKQTKKISTITIKPLNLKLSFDNNQTIYLESRDKEYTEEIDEYDLNINYVVLVQDKGKITEILVGDYLDIIKIDDIYYEISSEDYNKLLKIIENYIY